MMPDNRGGTKSDDEARLLQAPAKIDVISGFAAHEAADRFQRCATIGRAGEGRGVQPQPVLACRRHELVHPRFQGAIARNHARVGIGRTEEARCRADGRVPECRNEPLQVIRREAQIGVANDDDVHRRHHTEGSIQSRRLSRSAAEPQRLCVVACRGPSIHELPRAVRGPVIDEHDVETVARPLEELDAR